MDFLYPFNSYTTSSCRMNFSPVILMSIDIFKPLWKTANPSSSILWQLVFKRLLQCSEDWPYLSAPVPVRFRLAPLTASLCPCWRCQPGSQTAQKENTLSRWRLSIIGAPFVRLTHFPLHDAVMAERARDQRPEDEGSLISNPSSVYASQITNMDSQNRLHAWQVWRVEGRSADVCHLGALSSHRHSSRLLEHI